jgi:four helix bundle protein
VLRRQRQAEKRVFEEVVKHWKSGRAAELRSYRKVSPCTASVNQMVCGMEIRSAKDLLVYKRAFEVANEVFKVTRRFPSEERFALTGQIRRSSRSVCNNLREAWAKRRYEGSFISKLTDCDGECGETDTSLDFCLTSEYITRDEHSRLVAMNDEVGKMLGSMIRDPSKFILPR